MKTVHKIINGDSREMNYLLDESIHLIVTSPPYWQLKDYGTESQIGFNECYEDYINNLNLVWKECYRVLHQGCRLCVNIGDQFARSVYYGRYKVIPIRTEIIKFCEIIGFDYMGSVIWQKVTTTNTTGGATIMGSFPYPRNGILKIDYEFIMVFKKQGLSPKPTEQQKKLSILTTEEWNTYFSGHWNFSGVKQDKHLAMFPEELPKRLIKMFSFVGETVLDPFLGSGTTSLAARNLDRNSVGYEINNEYLPYINNKLNINQTDLSGSEYILSTDKAKVDHKEEIIKLPYIFKDPHKLNNIINPKILQFGSKIDKNYEVREEYYSIKEIISPVFLKLNNGMIVHLLGIKENKLKYKEAMDYLTDKVTGEKVFLKYDNLKHDENGHLLCYMYLKNNTFINAHLIKEGLVGIDNDMDYRYKDKFIRMEAENG